jgi:5-deoxy-glucuronate isomerase
MAFCDDPAHAWIRQSWAGQPVDRRLPMARHDTGEEER